MITDDITQSINHEVGSTPGSHPRLFYIIRPVVPTSISWQSYGNLFVFCWTSFRGASTFSSSDTHSLYSVSLHLLKIRPHYPRGNVLTWRFLCTIASSSLCFPQSLYIF